MTTSAKATALSLMAAIDEVREKLTDGEYLNMCNLLKQLNTEIDKNNNANVNNNDVNNYDSDDDSDHNYEDADITPAEALDGELEQLNNEIEGLNMILRDIDSSHEVRHREIYVFNTSLEKFNTYINNINNNIGTIEEHKWFMCACGMSVCTNAVLEHMTCDTHIGLN